MLDVINEVAHICVHHPFAKEELYLKKRIKELDEHPELNKNGKISQEQAEKCFKYFVVFLLLATFIILAIHVSIYGGRLFSHPLCKIHYLNIKN